MYLDTKGGEPTLKGSRITRERARDHITTAQINLLKAEQILFEVKSILQINQDAHNVPPELIAKIDDAHKIIYHTNYNELDDIQEYLIYHKT